MTRMKWERARWDRLGARLPTENTGGNLTRMSSEKLPEAVEQTIIRQALYEEAQAEAPTEERIRTRRKGRRNRKTYKLKRMGNDG